MKRAKTIFQISALLLTFIVTKQLNAMQDTQIWKAVQALEGKYEISNTGLFRNSKGKILRTYLRGGYLAIKLSNKKAYYIHRIVADVFIDNPSIKPQVNHKNGIKTDNRVENLEWVTCSENRIHAFKTGLCFGYVGSNNPSAKLTEKQVTEIRKGREMGYSIKTLCFIFGVSDTQIWKIIKKEKWKYL